MSLFVSHHPELECWTLPEFGRLIGESFVMMLATATQRSMPAESVTARTVAKIVQVFATVINAMVDISEDVLVFAFRYRLLWTLGKPVISIWIAFKTFLSGLMRNTIHAECVTVLDRIARVSAEVEMKSELVYWQFWKVLLQENVEFWNFISPSAHKHLSADIFFQIEKEKYIQIDDCGICGGGNKSKDSNGDCCPSRKYNNQFVAWLSGSEQWSRRVRGSIVYFECFW